MSTFRGMALIGLALAAPLAAQPPKPAALSPAQFDQLMRTAGYVKAGNAWKGCDGATTVTRQNVEFKDLNGDGRPEALITADGTECFGMTGAGFQLLRQTASGWQVMANETGIATFQTTRGVDGYPDIEIGGPGFCFPIARWSGSEYKTIRFAYEGKPCKPPH